MTAATTCRHWIGSDSKGRVCGAEAIVNFPYCAKHWELEKTRVAKQMEKDRERRAKSEAAWRARNVSKLPQWRVALERAEAEYNRRTASAVDDRAAYGGATHPSISRSQATVMSDSNVTRVVELQRIIKTLRADIHRAVCGGADQ